MLIKVLLSILLSCSMLAVDWLLCSDGGPGISAAFGFHSFMRLYLFTPPKGCYHSCFNSTVHFWTGLFNVLWQSGVSFDSAVGLRETENADLLTMHMNTFVCRSSRKACWAAIRFLISHLEWRTFLGEQFFLISPLPVHPASCNIIFWTHLYIRFPQYSLSGLCWSTSLLS